MKEYYARLPFGTEQRLNLGFGSTCPACDVVRGSLHEFGCMAEECPECHRPVVSCYCECLQPKDEIRITMAIEKTFTSMEDAHRAGAGAGKRNAATLTPTDKAAIIYVTNNAPPELKKKFDQGFLKIFSDLKPCGTSREGKPVYSTADIAKALGEDVAEINETAAAMAEEDSGLGITAINSTAH